MNTHDETLNMSLASLEKSKEASQQVFEFEIPGYELKSELGRGSFGIVYEAIRLQTGQRVALKLVTHERRLHWEYFARELALLLDLEDHPYTLTVLDAKLDGEHPYIVTPLVEGGSLQNSGKSELKSVGRWIVQVAEALHYIHSKGVIHCDLKPSNIYLSTSDSIRVGDLGQSRRLIEGEGALGTLGFMAPEQCSLDPDKRVLPSVLWDVYGFGATAYWLLTGVRPRISETDQEEMARLSGVFLRASYYCDCLRQNPLVPVRKLNPKVDYELAAIVEGCLRVEPDKRTPTINDVLDDLRRRQNGEPLHCLRPWTPDYLVRVALRRRAVQFLLVLLVVLAVAGYALYQGAQDRMFYAHTESGIHAQESGRSEEAYLHWLAALRYRARDKTTLQRLAFLPIRATYPHEDVVRSLSISCDNEVLATASADGTCALWSLETGEQLDLLRHKADVREVAFSPTDPNLLITASWDGTAIVYDRAARATLRVLTHEQDGYAPGLTNLCISPDGKQVAIADDNGGIRLWTVATGQALSLERAAESEEGVFQQLAFHPRGGYFAGLTRGQTARVWDTSSGFLVSPPLEHPGEVTDLQFHPALPILASCQERSVRLWEIVSGKQQTKWVHEAGINLMSYSPKGDYLAAAGNEGSVRIWDSVGKSFDFPHSRPVRSLSFSREGNLLAVGTGQKSILWSTIEPNGAARVWDLNKKIPVSEVFPHDGPISQVLFHPDGRHVLTASGSERGLASLYRGLARSWVIHVPQVASPEAGTGSSKGHRVKRVSPSEIEVNSSDGQVLAKITHGSNIQINEFALSPDQKWLITGAEDWTARIWSIPGGQALFKPFPHDGAVQAVEVSPDGAWIASACDFWTGSPASAVRLWDAATGEPISPPLHCAERLTGLTFLEGGKKIRGSWSNGSLVWDISPPSSSYAALKGEISHRLRCSLDARGALVASP